MPLIASEEPLAWDHRIPIRFALRTLCSKLHDVMELAGPSTDPVYVNRIISSLLSTDGGTIALDLRNFLASLVFLPFPWHPFLQPIIRWLITIHTPGEVINAASLNIDALSWLFIRYGEERELICDIASAISEVCLEIEDFTSFEALTNFCFWTLLKVTHLCPIPVPTANHSSPVLDSNYAFLPLVRVALRVLRKLPLPDIDTKFFDNILDVYDYVCSLEKLCYPDGFNTPVFVDGTLRDLRGFENTSKEFEYLLAHGMQYS